MAIHRYVKLYSKFFSPDASKPVRGRRWSLDDIELLLSIKALYHDRTGEAGITELLAGGWRLTKNPLANQDKSRELLADLLDVAELYQAQAKQTDREAQELIRDYKALKTRFDKIEQSQERLAAEYERARLEWVTAQNLKQKQDRRRRALKILAWLFAKDTLPDL
jgi:hypothetical protein